jgi:hypothetical protein
MNQEMSAGLPIKSNVTTAVLAAQFSSKVVAPIQTQRGKTQNIFIRQA